MKNEHSANEPKVKPCPIIGRTSDLDFDFGAPVLPDPRTMCDCWRAEQVERDRGLRADVYASLGLM